MENKIIGEFNRTTGLLIKTDEGQLVGVITPTERVQQSSTEDITERVIRAIAEHECAVKGELISDLTTGFGYRSIEFSVDIFQEGEEDSTFRSYTIEPTTIY